MFKELMTGALACAHGVGISPIIRRCLRAGVLTLAAIAALMGTWAAWHYPRITHWSAEKYTCAALLDGASWAALLAAAGGITLQASSAKRDESKTMWVVIGTCLLLGVYFGSGRQ